MKLGFKLPPLWKVRREAIRIGAQADGLLHSKTGFSVAHNYQRAVIGRKRKLFKGELPIAKRAALYLIFPKEGVLASHRIALTYLIRSGYTPIVISNQPLSPQDRAGLLPQCALLMERPNFGYDFGGYQDGMRCAAPYLDQLDHLAIFNDSCWFPVNPEIDWLAIAEANPADFVGAAAHEGMTTDGVVDFSVENWVMDTTRDLFHISSFALHFKGKLLHSDALKSFWENYEPTGHKTLTILRGEIGLTQHVLRSGFSFAVTQDTTRLDQLLDALPDDRLFEIASNLVHHHFPELAAVIQTATPDRLGQRNLILTTVARQGPSYALLDFDTRERKGVFVKKAPINWTRESAAATLRVLDKFTSPEALVFREEAHRMWARKAESLAKKGR